MGYWILGSVDWAILYTSFLGRISRRRPYFMQPYNKVLYQVLYDSLAESGSIGRAAGL